MIWRTCVACSTTSSPSTRAVPPDGRRTVIRTRRVVVFPAPLGPSRPKTSPGATWNVMSSTAVTLPSYTLERCETSMATELPKVSAPTDRFVSLVTLELQEVHEAVGLQGEGARFQQELLLQRREIQGKGQIVHEGLVIHRLLQEVREREAVLARQQEVPDQLHQLRPHVGRELLLRRGEIREPDPALAVGLGAELLLDLEPAEPLQQNIEPAVGQRLHGDHPAQRPGREDRRGAVVVRLPTLFQQDHADHLMAGGGVPNHPAVAGCENMQRQVRPREKDHVREGKQRDDAGNPDRREVAPESGLWTHVHERYDSRRPFAVSIAAALHFRRFIG